MSDLAAWLLERIAEDEALAAGRWTGPHSYEVPNISMGTLGAPPRTERERARVLAECAAKRRIVERFLRGPLMEESGEYGYVDGLEAAMRALASVYASHPAWREEWAL